MNWEWLPYLAPVLPAVTPLYNSWESWKKQHKLRMNLLLVFSSVVVAWALMYFSGEKTRTESTHQRATIQELLTRQEDLLIQQRDMQNDLDKMRDRDHILAERHRDATESDHKTTTPKIKISPTATATRQSLDKAVAPQ